MVASFAVQAKGWRWGLWEIVWFTGPILVVFLFAYPETSADNVLRRRAQRLRKLTGKSNIKSQSEIDQEKLQASGIFWDAIIKPTEIMIKDPAVAFTNIYVSGWTPDDFQCHEADKIIQTSLTYGIYYSFFEVFPLVYPSIYAFNLGQVGLCVLTIGVACLIGVTDVLVYQIYYLIPDIKKNGLQAPEHRLVQLYLVFAHCQWDISCSVGQLVEQCIGLSARLVWSPWSPPTFSYSNACLYTFHFLTLDTRHLYSQQTTYLHLCLPQPMSCFRDRCLSIWGLVEVSAF